MLNEAAPISNRAALAALAVRDLKSRSGIRGALAHRASMTTKRAIRATPTTTSATEDDEREPVSAAPMTLRLRSDRPPVAVRAPATSKLAGPWSGGVLTTTRWAIAAAAMPTGTLMN